MKNVVSYTIINSNLLILVIRKNKKDKLIGSGEGLGKYKISLYNYVCKKHGDNTDSRSIQIKLKPLIS
jgi:hypothetical protein